MPRKNIESQPSPEDESNEKNQEVFDATEKGDYKLKENNEGVLEFHKKEELKNPEKIKREQEKLQEYTIEGKVGTGGKLEKPTSDEVDKVESIMKAFAKQGKAKMSESAKKLKPEERREIQKENEEKLRAVRKRLTELNSKLSDGGSPKFYGQLRTWGSEANKKEFLFIESARMEAKEKYKSLSRQEKKEIEELQSEYELLHKIEGEIEKNWMR